ncbi:MAG: hypothetical protein M1814_001430 [Vezdaea aestivalis]|nr:MAG: hypothetical protein M1814_001430 [Vezdaea aestivalis]
MSPSSPARLGSAHEVSHVYPSPSPSPPLPGSVTRLREPRTSFCSVKEDDDSNIPQSFSESKQSTFLSQYNSLPTSSDALEIVDMATTISMQQTPSFCCPCGSFTGWKQVGLRDRHHHKSKSVGDLRLWGADFSQGWQWAREDSPERQAAKKAKTETQRYSAGQAPLEQLPAEVLDMILPLLTVDLPPNGYSPRNMDLMSCLLTSKTFHAATLRTLYFSITIPHSYVFAKFLRHVQMYPALGGLVRRLDFSHFTSVGLGRSARDNDEIHNLTAKTMLDCLTATPRLQEMLVQESVHNDIDAKVLRRIFCGLPQLKAVDFCGASSQQSRNAFMAVITASNIALPLSLSIQRLSLHECATLPSSIFEVLLPRLPRLTHLDVGRTQINDKALLSIPLSAQLSHLNISKCTNLTGERVVDFLNHHPAAFKLVYLNLLADLSRHRLLLPADLERLLPSLPRTLRSLNLGGAKVSKDNLPQIIPLTKHLEELGLGYANLSMEDLNTIFVTPPAENEDGDIDLLDESSQEPTALHYLDLTGVNSITIGTLLSPKSLLKGPKSEPLEVIELGGPLIDKLKGVDKGPRNVGWVTREVGRRGWWVRKPLVVNENAGKRPWKLGARWWGMRKVPVAHCEVGGIYGHYMFKI